MIATVRRSRWWLWGIAGVGALVLALGAVSWWVAWQLGPLLTRERVEASLGAALERPVTIDGVAMRPWLGRVGLVGVRVAAGPTWEAGTLLTLARAEARLGIASVWRREIVISTVLLEDADLRHVAAAGGPWALPDHIPDRVRVGPLTLLVRAVDLRQGRVSIVPAAGPAVEVEGLRARVRLDGTGLAATLSAATLRLAAREPVAIEQAGAEVELRDGILRLQRVAGRWRGQLLGVAGEVRHLRAAPTLALTVQGAVSLEALGDVVGWSLPIEGTATLDGAVTGALTSPALSARVTVPDLTGGPLKARNVSGQVAWSGGEVRLTGVVAKLTLPGELAKLGTADATLEARVAGGAVDILSGTARWAAIRVESVAGRLSGEGPIGLRGVFVADVGRLGRLWGETRGAGQVTVTAVLGGRWRHLVIDGRAHSTTLSLAGARVDDVHIPFQLDGLTLAIKDALAVVGRSRLQATGTLTTTSQPGLAALIRSIGFDIDVSVPAARVEDLDAWVPAEWRGTGHLALSGRFSGTPVAWRGEGRLEASAVTLRGQVIDSLVTRFTVDQRGLELSELEGRPGT